MLPMLIGALAAMSLAGVVEPALTIGRIVRARVYDDGLAVWSMAALPHKNAAWRCRRG
jgi:hypothetical protein